jgi:hypothetical protein
MDQLCWDQIGTWNSTYIVTCLIIIPSSVVTVMTDVFQKNEINLLRKFAKIMRIFDKIDDSKN